MLPTPQGSIRLGRIAGIRLFVHWSWLIVAAYQIQNRPKEYSSLGWAVAEYLALFVIVLMHEFGHSLACRQTGGTADQIILWPLGGVAYVAPPPRPGAVLWSIVAGPLVNLVLVPVIFGAWFAAVQLGWGGVGGDWVKFLWNLFVINLLLLVFNLLPVFPLDGGQILRALLWFPLGPVRSLYYASLTGFLGVAGLVALAIWMGSIWMGVLAFFVLTNCLGAFRNARAMAAMARLQREPGSA